MSALTVDMTVKDGKVALVDEFGWRVLAPRYAKEWGEGIFLKCRIEPEDEAATWADFKHLYGHLYTPVSERTGETVAEVHIRMKVQFMPDDGRTSLKDLNRAELKTYIESVEQDIRENDPDSWDDCLAAMALYESTNARPAASRRRA